MQENLYDPNERNENQSSNAQKAEERIDRRKSDSEKPDLLSKLSECLESLFKNKLIVSLIILIIQTLVGRFSMIFGHPIVNHSLQASSLSIMFIGEIQLINYLKSIPLADWQIVLLDLVLKIMVWETIKHIFWKQGD